MGDTGGENLARQWAAVRAAVLTVVSTLPDGIVEVTESREEESLEILPSRPGAPTLFVANGIENEIGCDIAGTHFWVWGEDDVALADAVFRVASNVVRHGFIRAGGRGRVPLEEGYIDVGEWTLTPWRWLRDKTVFPPFL